MVFTTIGRLDLLAFGSPVRITARVRKEHANNALADAERELATCIEEGSVTVEHAAGSRRRSALLQRYRNLSPVDVEGLAWALEGQGILLADDQDLVAAAANEGVQVYDVPAVVVALQENGMAAKDVKALAFEIEWTAKRPFKQAHRRRFGLE